MFTICIEKYGTCALYYIFWDIETCKSPAGLVKAFYPGERDAKSVFSS